MNENRLSKNDSRVLSAYIAALRHICRSNFHPSGDKVPVSACQTQISVPLSDHRTQIGNNVKLETVPDAQSPHRREAHGLGRPPFPLSRS